MKEPNIIYLQHEETDCGRTWCKDKINDDDTMYIKAGIVESEIRCIHNDMGGFEKSHFAISVDGAKRLKRHLTSAMHSDGKKLCEDCGKEESLCRCHIPQDLEQHFSAGDGGCYVFA